MKILLSKINQGSVKVDSATVSSCNRGLVLFVGIEKGDNDLVAKEMANKVINLRIFANDKAKMDYSLKDLNLELLCIPNFTLCARTSRGRRPSFDDTMAPIEASSLFDEFVQCLLNYGVVVKKGSFGKHMDIDLSLNGPVNIILDSKSR
tara:strand:- start:2317 stop:2763 length:447 start_codon:yes stop_codon:yes gene_type:complete